MDTAPMTPPHSSEIPKQKVEGERAADDLGRVGVAAATISAWIQKAMRPDSDRPGGRAGTCR